jgi:hypothetical protein
VRDRDGKQSPDAMREAIRNVYGITAPPMREVRDGGPGSDWLCWLIVAALIVAVVGVLVAVALRVAAVDERREGILAPHEDAGEVAAELAPVDEHEGDGALLDGEAALLDAGEIDRDERRAQRDGGGRADVRVVDLDRVAAVDAGEREHEGSIGPESDFVQFSSRAGLTDWSWPLVGKRTGLRSARSPTPRVRHTPHSFSSEVFKALSNMVEGGAADRPIGVCGRAAVRRARIGAASTRARVPQSTRRGLA